MSVPPPLQGKRILVIEDDYYLATDEKALLERAGAEVAASLGRGSGLAELTAAGPIDAAVVDINLGEGPDFSFARLLRERDIPFLFVTGYDAAVIPAAHADAPRLEKPMRERDFIAAVARLLDVPYEGSPPR